MAKFRQGDLVLQSTQSIIQGGVEILAASGAADFVTLDVSGASSLASLDVSGAASINTLGVSGLSTLASLLLASGATINEFSIDGTLGGDSDLAVPTEKAVKTYVDAQIGGTVPAGVDEAIVRYDGINSVQDSGIFIDDSNNITGINNVDATGITSLLLTLGSTINEFSIDGTLGGDSDLAVPTEKAVKTYVDAKIGGIVSAGVDEAVVRYDGTTSVQVSGIFIDDLDNVTGINNLYVSGDITIGGNTILNSVGETAMELKANAAVEFYYDNAKVGETTANGITGAVWG